MNIRAIYCYAPNDRIKVKLHIIVPYTKHDSINAFFSGDSRDCMLFVNICCLNENIRLIYECTR